MASKIHLYIFSFLLFQQFNLLLGQDFVKGAYWFRASEFPLEDINSTLFTHLFCAFADLDAQTNQLVISESNQDSFSNFTTTVQQKNPTIKTLLSIGGGRANDTAFASMATQPDSRQTFIDSSISLARSYGFHGLDLDWEYPETDSDMVNFGTLLDEWRSAVTTESRNLGREPLILTAAVSFGPTYNGLDYPVESISRNLDWINVMAYDMHGPTWSTVTNAPAPLYDPTGNHISGSDGVEAWIYQVGLSPKKLVMGFPFYGYAWVLVDPNSHGLLAPASGPVGSGDGSMGYNQIRGFIDQNQATTVFDEPTVSDYCYAGTTWIGYDDYQSTTSKAYYAKDMGLLGYFAWHVGVDYNWVLSQGASEAWDTSSLLVKKI